MSDHTKLKVIPVISYTVTLLLIVSNPESSYNTSDQVLSPLFLKPPEAPEPT